MSGVFITGTDTGVGKSVVASAMVAEGVARGLRVAGMKPVSAGCVWTDEGWLNEDAVQLRVASNVPLPLSLINPYAFEPPIAPHIAAQQQNVIIDLKHIERAYHEIAARADWVVVEGAGGLLVPLDDTHTLADLILRLNLPVMLVVGMRLGCLNHALLTVEALYARNIRLLGWVANGIDPDMRERASNLSSLEQRINAPLLGVIPPFSVGKKPISLRWEMILPGL